MPRRFTALWPAGLTMALVTITLLAATSTGLADTGAHRWSDADKATLGSMRLSRLPAPPTDPSNAVEARPEAIALGKCSIALITLAGRPRAEGMATGTAPRNYGSAAPDVQFEYPFGPTVVNQYAMAAMRHMHEFGTTSEQLAWIKVAASHHAQHNPHALLREVVTVEQVVSSPIIAVTALSMPRFRVIGSCPAATSLTPSA